MCKREWSCNTRIWTLTSEEFSRNTGIYSIFLPMNTVPQGLTFKDSLAMSSHAETVRLIMESDQLIEDTIEGNEEAVAKALDPAASVQD
jgi:hypothetical protein